MDLQEFEAFRQQIMQDERIAGHLRELEDKYLYYISSNSAYTFTKGPSFASDLRVVVAAYQLIKLREERGSEATPHDLIEILKEQNISSGEAGLLAHLVFPDDPDANDEEFLQRLQEKTKPKPPAIKPIRLLHLSDLHFTGRVSPSNQQQLLLEDLESLNASNPDLLIISGDLMDRGDQDGLEKAGDFILRLLQKLNAPTHQLIITPGNHDVQDNDNQYEWRSQKPAGSQDEVVVQGDIFLTPNRRNYNKRFQAFAKLHEQLTGRPYPLDPEQQGFSHCFSKLGLQILALNSAWRIDRFHRRLSGIHSNAVGNAINAANEQRNKLDKSVSLLRLAVWHHAAAGPDAMQDLNFISRLHNAGVKVGLHGDVHEMRAELINYQHASGGMHIIGSGSFGATREGLPDATPRLYNLLEIQRDLSRIRVQTRCQGKPDEAWKGFYEWPNPQGDGKVDYYDIEIETA